ncbi:hypothetical protein ES702_00208 [subsurface metagenome]
MDQRIFKRAAILQWQYVTRHVYTVQAAHVSFPQNYLGGGYLPRTLSRVKLGRESSWHSTFTKACSRDFSVFRQPLHLCQA